MDAPALRSFIMTLGGTKNPHAHPTDRAKLFSALISSTLTAPAVPKSSTPTASSVTARFDAN